jgi:DNA-binding MarR family transcriptional regulator
MVSVPAVSRIVKGLERDGLVSRKRLEDDRRFVRVVPSRKGRRLIERARARRLERIAAGLGSLDDRELAVVQSAAQVLERLGRNRIAKVGGDPE